MKDAGLTVSLDTNDDPDDGWEGGLDEAMRYVDIFSRISVRLRKQRGLTKSRNRSAKARGHCAPGCGEVGEARGRWNNAEPSAT